MSATNGSAGSSEGSTGGAVTVVEHLKDAFGLDVGLHSDGYTGTPIRATLGRVGDAVRFTSYGGAIALVDTGTSGVISRFTRHGNPVIRYRSSLQGGDFVERSDRDGCAALTATDAEGTERLLYTVDLRHGAPTTPERALAARQDAAKAASTNAVHKP
ncbi:MAG: hypothetical protein GY901_09800 [Actinomycetia bacterium]|nr:hypothetical protein [Actinomycetes bacterium]